MSRLVAGLFTVLAIGYPVLVYFTLERLSPIVLALFLAGIALARLLLGRHKGDPLLVAAGVVAMMAAAAWTLLSRSSEGLRFYPVLMNLSVLTLFAWSLGQPQSIVERLARLARPDLPAAGVAYARRVTLVWCAFFLCNGAVAAWTAVATSWATWTLYNGLIAYVLMGLLFAGEYTVRRRVMSGAAS